MSTATERLAEQIARLGVQLELFDLTLKKQDELLNGTAKTGGLRERIVLAEQDIKKNKESFDTINKNIGDLRTEMLVEIGKLVPPKKGINWDSVWQAVVTAIAIGVTVMAFWKLIEWLATNSPVR